MKHLLMLICLFVLGVSDAAERSVRTVQVQHVPAPQLADSLRPLLPEGARVSSHQNTLILNVSDAEWQNLQTVIASLDLAPQALLIEVRQTRGGASARSGARQYSTAENNQQIQKVRATSGQAAVIDVGQLQPQQHWQWFPQTGAVVSDTRWQYSGSAVRVLADVRGDTAQVRLQPLQNLRSNSSGASRIADADLQFTAPLGEWITVAESGSHETQDTHLRTRDRDHWRVDIRILSLQ